MTERNILFRGFCPDDDGDTIIILHGEKIRGDWIYWDKFGNVLYDEDTTSFSSYDLDTDIILETVGQWAKSDDNGKDMFEGDIVKCRYENYIKVWYETYEVFYFNCAFGLKTLDDKHFIPFGNSTHRACELIGNKWENEVTE